MQASASEAQLQSADWMMKSNLENRQGHLEKRIDSLESVMLEINVFLARLSAEVLSLKVSSPINRKGTFFTPTGADHPEQSGKIKVHHNPQEETIIESYTFHQSQEKGSSSSSSSSDLSSHKSFDSDSSKPYSSSWRIPFYSGERDAEVIWAWLDKVEAYFKLGQAAEDEKVLIATYHLKDAAYLWWKNKSAIVMRAMRWEEFQKLFIKTFMPGNYLREIKFALMDLRQLESVKDYSSQFCRIVNRLVAGLSEEDKVAYYVHGLKCSVRMDVDEHNPQTLEDAIRIAETSEARKFSSWN